MPRGDKSAYTDKQKRQAKHIEDSELKSGRSQEDAERIAWATVNKQDGGGKKTKATKKDAASTPKSKTKSKVASKSSNTGTSGKTRKSKTGSKSKAAKKSKGVSKTSSKKDK